MVMITTYSLVLFFIISLILLLSFTSFNRNKVLFLFFSVLILSILGAFFNPDNALANGDYTDLVRFYETIDSIKGYPFMNDIIIFQEYNNIPVMKVLLFIISRIGVNNLLPFISAFCFYGIFGYFILKVSNKYSISNRIFSLAFWIFICLFNYKMVITNIRCPLGNSIFMLTLYYDIFSNNKKHWYILGYLICCGIHPIFILFTCIRVLFKFATKHSDKLFYGCILLYSLFINYLLDFLSTYTNIQLFSYMSMKLDFYFNYWDGGTPEFLIIYSGYMYIGVLCYLLFLAKKYISSSSNENKIFKLSIAFLLLAISSYWNFVIFQRSTWLLIFLIVYWYIYLKGVKGSSNSFSIFIYDIVVFALVFISLVFYFLTYQYGVLTF